MREALAFWPLLIAECLAAVTDADWANNLVLRIERWVF
jgi:hypothetical protein